MVAVLLNFGCRHAGVQPYKTTSVSQPATQPRLAAHAGESRPNISGQTKWKRGDNLEFCAENVKVYRKDRTVLDFLPDE